MKHEVVVRVTVVMTFLVVEVEEADSDLVGMGKVDVIFEMLENAENESHKYKPTSKITLLNSDKKYGKQSIFIVIAKEEMVVVIIDIVLKFYVLLFIKI